LYLYFTVSLLIMVFYGMVLNSYSSFALDGEVWKSIPGFDSHYEASNYGRIRSIKSKRVLRPYANRSGYEQYYLKRGLSEKKTMMRHRLVALAWVGPIPEGYEVNHIDGDKENNRPENLEYLTHAENMRHASRKKLFKPARGEASTVAKLNWDQVRKIRELYASGEFSTHKLAELYCVSQPNILQIVKRITWTE
jgi:hypothetical protein